MNLQANTITGKRILLVEDERAVREALRVLFTMDAHTVVEANNGAEALALFRNGRFDLVVTDFEMPFVKGDELAARIRRLSPQQPILMLTAYSHKRSVENPVDVVVNKPFDSTLLRETMAELLLQPGENSRQGDPVEAEQSCRATETEIVAA
jgi:two-component system phosphate regulon response regulator PhoB